MPGRSDEANFWFETITIFLVCNDRINKISALYIHLFHNIEQFRKCAIIP